MSDDFDRLAREVYLGARDGVLDVEAAFDLACLLMADGSREPAVSELAERCADGGDSEGILDLARRVLAVTTWEPGFEEEPSWLEELQRALAVVAQDLTATGLAGQASLVVDDDNDVQHAHALFQGGGSGSTVGVIPSDGNDPVGALVAVADDLQNSVMHMLWGTVWPVCPDHNLGAHARDHDGMAVWWCNGVGGHVSAAIGRWGR